MFLSICSIKFTKILYISEKFGTDNFCIGTDFFGTDSVPEGLSNYEGFNFLREKLQKEGMVNGDIDKLFYRNLCDFLS